jgi:hypothetical protein
MEAARTPDLVGEPVKGLKCSVRALRATEVT